MTTISVQTVLYNAAAGSIERYVRGLLQATAALQATRDVAISLAFADCSPEPVLDGAQVAALDEQLRAGGIERFNYRFLDQNLGHGGAQNVLLADNDSEFVMILNPDTCAGPRSFVELLTAMQDPSVGIAEARQLPLENQKDFDRHTGDTSWASGACSLVRAEVFAAVGGYDTDCFFLYCDDVDFSWRTKLAGYRVVHWPAAAVFHDKRVSLGGHYVDSDNEKYHSALASLLLAHKYSRDDIVRAGLGYLDNLHDPVVEPAAQEFRRRQAAGELPAELDPEHQVGQFQTYAFADVRF